MTSSVYDVAVVGAGIIGTTIAERLAFEGKKVVLIDRDGPGEGCSKGNAGHFATDIILPLANMDNLLKVPKMMLDPLGPLTIRWSYFHKLLPWLMRYGWAAMPHNTKRSIEAIKLLNRPSIERFDLLLKRTGLTELMSKQGALTVYKSTKAAVENAAHAEFVRKHGVNVQQLSGDETRELEPALDSSVSGSLYYPDTAHTIDPYRLVRALHERFVQSRGTFIKANVDTLDIQDDYQVKLHTSAEPVIANEVIIACGAWSKTLAAQAGHKVPLETERGYHLMLPKPKVDLTRPVVSFERSFVMTPMQHGMRLAGTVELAGLDAEQNNERADILFRHAGELLPGIERTEAQRWMGHRPSTPDSLPVIGRSPKHKNVLFAFGHQHLGLTQAAVTADLISEVVFKRPHKVDITPFRVDRF